MSSSWRPSVGKDLADLPRRVYRCRGLRLVPVGAWFFVLALESQKTVFRVAPSRGTTSSSDSAVDSFGLLPSWTTSALAPLVLLAIWWIDVHYRERFGTIRPTRLTSSTLLVLLLGVMGGYALLDPRIGQVLPGETLPLMSGLLVVVGIALLLAPVRSTPMALRVLVPLVVGVAAASATHFMTRAAAVEYGRSLAAGFVGAAVVAAGIVDHFTMVHQLSATRTSIESLETRESS